MPLPSPEKERYTYADYLSWPDKERWEIINGVAYNMTPAPSTQHQRVAGELFVQIHNFLVDKECQVFFAPFDVRLLEAEADRDDNEDEKNTATVVQPDITIICDPENLDEKGCKGPPDLIVEITSPSTATKDHIEKLALYEKHGVREYWIVQPVDKIIYVYELENAKYGKPDVYGGSGTMQCSIFQDLKINLGKVFDRASQKSFIEP
jgi:Uma2 family endonuclease